MKSALCKSIGQLLCSIEGLFYIPSGSSDLSMKNLDQLRIKIGSCYIRFTCNNDGESLAIDQYELCPKDLGQYGSFCSFDLSNNKMFSDLMNTKLLNVYVLKSYGKKYEIGYIFEFEPRTLVICNWGDELSVWDRVPETYFDDEGIQADPICL